MLRFSPSRRPPSSTTAECYGSGVLQGVIWNFLCRDEFSNCRDFVLQMLEGADVSQIRMITPKAQKKLAGCDGGGGVFEAAEVGGVAVVDAERRARLKPDDRVIAAQLVMQRRPKIAPIFVWPVRPVRGAVDR